MTALVGEEGFTPPPDVLSERKPAPLLIRILRRTLPMVVQALATCLIVVIGSFLLIRFVPGDPVTSILGTRATPETSAALRHELNLDQPLYKQLATTLSDTAHGDLGNSLANPGQSVWDLLGPALPVTLGIAAIGIMLSVIIGVAVGVSAAVSRSRLLDLVVQIAAVVSLATPAFLVALLLVLAFALRFTLFPAGGWGDGFDPKYVVLPALTLSFALAPVITRTARQAARSAVGEASVEAAIARGVPLHVIAIRHVAPNSLLPVISVVGVNIGMVLTSAMVVESVLGIPGLGSRILEAVSTRDYPVIQAIALLTAVFAVTANLLADLLYGLLDPRLRRSA